MANESICSECGGDRTRCDCHKKRPPRPYEPTIQEKIEVNEAEIKTNLAKLRRLRNN